MSKFDPRRKPHHDRCGATGKRRFKSESAALRFIAELGSNLRAVSMRAYSCPFCAGFHLSSQDKGYWKARDAR